MRAGKKLKVPITRVKWVNIIAAKVLFLFPANIHVVTISEENGLNYTTE